MYPSTFLPEPLKHAEFYILLALSHDEAYAYQLKSLAAHASLGSFQLTDGTLYPLLTRLCEEGLIDLTGISPGGVSGKPRKHYAITDFGLIRLKEELKRLDHAVKIGKHNHLLNDEEIPTDIQKLMLNLPPSLT